MSKELAEKIAITVYGTDNKGEMFIEDTTTHVVAQDFVILTLRKRMAQGSEIIIFNKSNGNQAEFLLEASEAGGAFRARLKDLSVDVWELDFGIAPAAPPVPAEMDNRVQVHLVCKCCGTQESVRMAPGEQLEALRGEVLWRHCAHCAEETDWQASDWLSLQLKAVMPPPAEMPATPPPAPMPLPAALRPQPLPEVQVPEVQVEEPPPPPAPEPVAPPPINWAERRTSRRIQMKTGARLRRVDGRTEIVAPLNVSRGGIAFESTHEYALDERLMVAMHFKTGDRDPLEQGGQVVRVSPGDGRKEYGVRFNS